MDNGRKRYIPPYVAQKRRTFRLAVYELDDGAGFLGESAGDYGPGESGAGAEIDPAACSCRQRQELQRIGNVASPQLRNG